MKKAALSEVKDDLSKFLRIAEKEEVVITRHGKPASVLIGFEDEEDWFDEYWMNYGLTTMKKGGKAVAIKRIEDFIDFKGTKKFKNIIVPVVTKKKS